MRPFRPYTVRPYIPVIKFVQEDIGEQRADHRTLDGPHLRIPDLAILPYPTA
jgi:hypothetical protein